MSKLAVFFPGIGYTIDKPLMHYSRRIAAGLGYEIKLLPYGGFPAKILGDRGRMEESARIAFEQAREMLADINFESYDDILFVGKSIGTIAAGRIASEEPVKDRIRLVLYTPLEETFSFDFGKAIVFTGSDDPWVGREKSRIGELAAERKYPCVLVPRANHSLESKDVGEDILNMQMIMNETERFIREG